VTLKELWEAAQKVGAEDFDLVFEDEVMLRYITTVAFDVAKKEIQIR
jgi:hypothetical protein